MNPGQDIKRPGPRTDPKHDGSRPSFSGVNPGRVRPGPRTDAEAQTVCTAECSILWKWSRAFRPRGRYSFTYFVHRPDADMLSL